MRLLSFFAMLVFSTLNSDAQPIQVLDGKVIDDEGRPVASASVRVLNSPVGGVTDGQGRFRLTGIVPGPRRLEVSAMGFALELKEVDVVAGKNLDLEIRMRRTDRALDAVVVSADRLEDDIFRVPVSVTSLDARAVKAFRLWELGDLSGLVPTLYSADPGDGRQVSSIRGIATTSYDPAVLTVIDGVTQFNLDTYIPQLLDIEKIEVLRGPQGTLYGRNAMGGVIRVSPKRPGPGQRTRWEITSGNYGQLRISAATQSTLKKDKLYLGVTMMQERRKGFFHNEATNSDFDAQRRFTGNYHLRFLPNQLWEWNLNVKHSYGRNDGAFPLADGYTLSQNAVGQMQDRNLNASLSVQRHGSTARMESITSFQLEPVRI
jgi:iron complex outermembrane receptor protein